MATDPAVLEKAQAYIDGELSTLEVYEWLSSRRSPITDDLEADLWGVAFEVDSGELDEPAARQWIRRKLEDNSPWLSTTARSLQLRAREAVHPTLRRRHRSVPNVARARLSAPVRFQQTFSRADVPAL